MFSNMTDEEIAAHLDALGCTPWDAADYLDNEETIKAYVEETSKSCLEPDMQPYVEAHITNCIATVNRARQRKLQEKTDSQQ